MADAAARYCFFEATIAIGMMTGAGTISMTSVRDAHAAKYLVQVGNGSKPGVAVAANQLQNHKAGATMAKHRRSALGQRSCASVFAIRDSRRQTGL